MVIVFAETHQNTLTQYLNALSRGHPGGAFIHLIPLYTSEYAFTILAGFVVALTIAESFTLAEAIHWHCHRGCGFEPFSITLVSSDCIHNAIDGIIIATRFFVSVPVGFGVTLGIMLHKIPKEIGDFGALLQGGVS